jgi:hypothetical protein
MKKIFLILPAVLLFAAACGQQPAQQTTPPAQTPAATNNSAANSAAQNQQQNQNQSQPAFNMVKITLDPQNNSGEKGTATIFDVQGKAKVIINMTGIPAKVLQPDHIHFGSCANLGGVKYPLTNVGNGAAQTMLPVSLAELVAQPFAINVHKSAAQINVYVACGDSLKMNKSFSSDPAMDAMK